MADQDSNPQPVDPQPTPTPDPPAPPVDPVPDSTPTPEPPPAAAKPDWRDSRIAQLTAQINKLKQAPPAPQPTPTPAPPAIDDAEIERRADARAFEREFNRQCSDCQVAGRAQFNDFDTRVNNLRQLVDTNNVDEVRRWNTFLSAAFETGNVRKDSTIAPRILYELGNDLNEAQRLLSLPPVQMAIALAQKAPQHSATDDPPPLPNPMRPVNDRGNSHARIEPDDPERADQIKDIAVWMTRRKAQAKERGIR